MKIAAKKVWFIPYIAENPYQQLLAGSLRKYGTEIKEIQFISLRESLTAKNVDIIHMHWENCFYITAKNKICLIRHMLASIIKIGLLKLRGVKIVHTVHNLMPHEIMDQNLEFLFNNILSLMIDKQIVHSPRALDMVKKHYLVFEKNKYHVIPCGHYIDYYENRISGEESRRILQIPQSKFVFLFFGLIRRYKGIERLIRVFKQMTDNRAFLLIAGCTPDPNFAQEISSLCDGEERIKYINKFIPRDEVQVYMNTADFVVCPYLETLTPGSILLAMSFAKPVVAPGEGSITDYVDERGGILYENSPEGLLGAMNEARCRTNYSEMGKYNFERAKAYDWDTIGRETNRAYEDVLPSAGGR